jgi:glycosyltransferase involved in cell wall biosynthesis
MIINRDIIIFGDDWGRHPSTLQHIGRILAANNRILWIGSISARIPNFTWSDFNRALEKITKYFSEKGEKNYSLDVNLVHPLVFPFFDCSVFRYINRWILKKTLQRSIKELGFQNPILITGNPLVADIVSDLGASSMHYFCLDDYSKFEGWFRIIPEMERKLLKQADSVFSVSRYLQLHRKPYTDRSIFLPQGVDVNHFKKDVTAIPSIITVIPSPRVGYFGSLTSWIDMSLIAECARMYPKVSFILIGRASVDLSILSNISNIYYLGEVPYQTLPKYASGFDIGLIPFSINELTLACNPLKLLEYFALGIPVVSTDLPEVRRFENLVYIAKDLQEFIGRLGDALGEKDIVLNTKRREMTERYSWKKIVELISSSIEDIEMEK